MPAVSKAQFAKMFQLYKEKKITKAQLDRFVGSVEYKKLPKRVKHAKRAKRNKKN
jgi:hypothetical protein